MRILKDILYAALFIIAAGAVAWHIGGARKPPQDYRDGTYEIEGIDVTLEDGISIVPTAGDSASVMTTRFFGNEAAGDLDGDGTPDVAFLLTQDGGGSGTFFYVAAALSSDDGFRGTNAVFIGDRIAPQTTEIRDGLVVVNFADRNPGEPMTARPSVGVSRYFRMEGGRLEATEGN